MISFARRLRAEMTLFERRLWQRLRGLNAQGFHFRRQAPFGGYILDFVDYTACLVIELDGEQHGEDRVRLRDGVRDEFLRNEGYRVLRFWNHELIEDIDAVVDSIYRAARNRMSALPIRDATQD